MVCCFFAFVVVFLLLPLYYALRYLWELLPVGNLRKKAVFITGCDSGFGRMLAIKCAENGMHVFAGCLTEQGAKSIEADATSLEGTVITVMIDVTKDDSVKKAADFVKKRLNPGISLWAVVNNAGIFATYGPDDWCSIEDYKQALDVNTFGIIRVSQAFKALLKQSKGRIISVTSVAGRVSLPCAGPYSVGKFASEAYMDCIRFELKPFGVTCCILEPGIFKTGLIDRDAMKRRIDGVWSKLTEEQREDYGVAFKDSFAAHWSDLFNDLSSEHVEYVVDSYYHAITARFPRYRYRCGWDALLFFIPITYLPTEIIDFAMKFLFDPRIKPAAIEKKKYQ